MGDYQAWIVGHWQRQITKLAYRLGLTAHKDINANYQLVSPNPLFRPRGRARVATTPEQSQTKNWKFQTPLNPRGPTSTRYE